MARLLTTATEFGDFSTEELQNVPLNRDYNLRPIQTPTLCEVVTHRTHTEHSTLARLYNYLLEIDKSFQPEYK